MRSTGLIEKNEKSALRTTTTALSHTTRHCSGTTRRLKTVIGNQRQNDVAAQSGQSRLRWSVLRPCRGRAECPSQLARKMARRPGGRIGSPRPKPPSLRAGAYSRAAGVPEFVRTGARAHCKAHRSRRTPSCAEDRSGLALGDPVATHAAEARNHSMARPRPFRQHPVHSSAQLSARSGAVLSDDPNLKLVEPVCVWPTHAAFWLALDAWLRGLARLVAALAVWNRNWRCSTLGGVAASSDLTVWFAWHSAVSS
jgi:hypothetical protein